jgi:hypothetical protein
MTKNTNRTRRVMDLLAVVDTSIPLKFQQLSMSRKNYATI